MDKAYFEEDVQMKCELQEKYLQWLQYFWKRIVWKYELCEGMQPLSFLWTYAEIDIKSQMETIQTKMRTSKFTTLDLRKLLEHIRNMEEDNGE